MARLRRGTPGLIRDLNRAAILGMIGDGGPIARVEIARRLALSAAAVTDITRELVEAGLVQQVEQGPSSGGRPPILLGLVGAAAQAVGVKIAADHLAFVRVDLNGNVLARRTEPFETAGPGALVKLADRLRGAVDEAGRGPGRLLGIGLGVPGIVDAAGNVTAPIVGWSGLALAPMLRGALGVPVLVDNDVNTLAVAERLYGRGRGVEHFITVTIGRGVGLGIVVGGDLYRGFGGGAGEFGHLPIADDGPPCECGKHGCLEAAVADPALARRAIDAGLVGTQDPDPMASLRRLADGGSEAARMIYADAGATLGRAVGGLVNVLSPQLIIVSGEGTEAWRHLAKTFRRALDAAVFPPLRGVRVDVDPWDDAKWARGAAALVLRATFTAPLYERQPEDAVRERLGGRSDPGPTIAQGAASLVAR
ncbi:MAG: ROK family protein [Chloroflexi bacterium]|nr:ROK family protein [Chloroflexota bacterium]